MLYSSAPGLPLMVKFGEPTMVAISMVVLTIHAHYVRKRSLVGSAEYGTFTSSPSDFYRDLSIPMNNKRRIYRMACDVAFLIILSSFALYHDAHRQAPMLNIISNTLHLCSWFYALFLVRMSYQYFLPDRWGWIINVHLFLLSLTTWCLALASAILSMTSDIGNDSAIDLVYITGSTPQGPPWIDRRRNVIVAGNGNASIFSFFTFSWAYALFKRGDDIKKYGPLREQDIPTLPPSLRPSLVDDEHFIPPSQSLLVQLIKENKLPIIAETIATIASDLLYTVPPFFMNKFLELIQNKDEEMSKAVKDGFQIALCMPISIVMLRVVSNQKNYWSAVSRVRVQTTLRSLIYRHSLRHVNITSISSVKEENDVTHTERSLTATVSNLISMDCDRIAAFASEWREIINVPVRILSCYYLLYYLLGVSSLVSVLLLLLSVPVNKLCYHQLERVQRRLMSLRDKRVSLMSEILQGIRQIKYLASEGRWTDRVMNVRGQELSILRTSFLYNMTLIVAWQALPLLAALASFGHFTLVRGQVLTPAIAFTSIALFSAVATALDGVPDSFVIFLEATTSLKRIQDFLSGNNNNTAASTPYTSLSANESSKFGFQDATLTWWTAQALDNSRQEHYSHTPPFTLSDVSVEFPLHKLSIIHGGTGSGKTLLLQSLLGESYTKSGKVFRPRGVPHITDSMNVQMLKSLAESSEGWILPEAVAYVPQTVWLQNATIRDNILFGLPFVESRYYDTIEACALEADLTVLDNGDLTEIGERGITLSGGQKTRIALARAVYSRAEYILMDDILSAVDARTGLHLMVQCLQGPLMQGRTRILSTHHIKWCLRQGGCAFVAEVKSGQVHGFDISEGKYSTRASASVRPSPVSSRTNSESSIALDGARRSWTASSTLSFSDSNSDLNDTIHVQDKPKTSNRLIQEEGRMVGSVKSSLYRLYLELAGGPLFYTGIACLIVGSRLVDISSSWWLKVWARAYEEENISLYSIQSTWNGSMEHPLSFYFGMYGLIILLSIAVSYIRIGYLYYGALRASKVLYAQTLQKILAAPLRFFDTTPVGRILNRFSKDVQVVDTSIPDGLMQCVNRVVVVISIWITIVCIFPIFTLPMLGLTVVTLWTGSTFVTSARELRRIASVLRSPIFAHTIESVQGITTIRAYGATRRFFDMMREHIEAHTRAYFFQYTANFWVSIRLAFLGGLINFLVSVVVLVNIQTVDAALAGFCISFTLLYSEQMYYALKRYATAEMSLNALERLSEYLEVESESPAITDYRPRRSWPQYGTIDVMSLDLRYAPHLPLVHRGVTFKVNANEKVGVVGRTGSGKSTLALALFRFIEPERGRILMDGVDIARMGTFDLRSRLSIIPQDPILFSGTLRSNLDPFNECSDEIIHRTLDQVQFYRCLSGLGPDDDILRMPVSEGGANFSQGQRQLLCLARSLLKRSKIVILDEATASVDYETDNLIQSTINSEFKDSTVLCIAHRLNTVIEYERILVLDKGEVAEYASPCELLADSSSLFYSLCEQSGELDKLVSAAAAAASKHQIRP